MEELNIRDSHYILKGAYRSIDIRGVLVKPKNQSNPNWICAFLKIRLTNETQEQLRKRHQELLDDCGQIRLQNFEVLLSSRHIQDFDALLKDVSNGVCKVEEIKFVFPDSEWKQIESKKVITDTNYSTLNERAGYRHAVFFIQMNQSISKLANDLGLSKKDFGGDLYRVRKWLEIQADIESDTNNIVVIFPIYCKKRYDEDPIVNLQKEAIAGYDIHKILINNSKAMITRSAYRSRESDYSKPLQISGLVEAESDDIATVRIPRNFDLISPDDSLGVQIIHDALGVIVDDRIDNDVILQPPCSLIDSFLLLDAKNNIKDIIGTDSNRQELAASWLMSLLGFRTIRPDRKDERISGTYHSVDVLCQYSKNILLVIDCKTSVPEESDLTLAKNAASHIAKSISYVNVIPLLISSEDCSGMKTNSGVSIMDSKVCKAICDLILKGRNAQAKLIPSHFKNLIFQLILEAIVLTHFQE